VISLLSAIRCFIVMRQIHKALSTSMAAAFLLLAACSSCRTASTSGQFLEDYFVCYGVVINHDEIFPNATLKNEADKEAVKEALTGYLRREPRGPQMRNPEAFYRSQVRSRDFCACLLASYTGIELHIFLSDRDPEKEQKIERLLTILNHHER
jgi:hypothetical protein